MGQKFNKGDLVETITGKDKLIVISYKLNHMGAILNYYQGGSEFADTVVTEEVLCEGRIDGKFQKKYINENSLQLVK